MVVLKKYKIFEAMTIQKSSSNLKIAFAENANPEGIRFIKEALEENSQFIELVALSDSPRYFVNIINQSFQLIMLDDERPVFKPIQGINQASAIDFINKIESVAKWVQTIELSNPNSSIRDQEIKIELFKIDQPGNYEDSAPASELDWHSPAVFSYEQINGEWQRPAFRLKIKNTGNHLLWVHALYMGNDFSITDQLLPKQDLKPSEEVWLTDVHEEFPFKTIPLQLEDAYQSWGISEIKEFVKLFISTEELAIHRFNQEGLQQDTPSIPKRGISRGIQLTAPDWTTREIEFIIQRPFEETSGAEPEEEIAEPDEVITPEPIPPSAPAPKPSPPVKTTIPPIKIPRPKSSSPSRSGKLKKWLKDLTRSKRKEADSPPPSKRSVEPTFPSSVEDWEKVYPELGEEQEETDSPPINLNRSITTEFDELLKDPEKQKTDLPDALKKEDAGEQVDCSIYAPPEVQKGDDVFIQVWLHLPQLSQKAKAMALEFDEEATQRAFQSLKVPLEKGDELSLVLETKDIEIDENVQHITWNGTLQSVQFVASIPEGFAKNKTIFTLRIFMGELPVGHIKFILKTISEPVKATAQPLGNEAKRYKKAFISYSSKDRNEVLKRVQMLDKVGIEFFQDVLNLNPGERWEKKLYENINDADIFFLFWSTAAKESKWVLQELEYAINLKHGDEDHPPLIQPVPIEGPPIVTPPEQLGHMHFNDRILYFILKK